VSVLDAFLFWGYVLGIAVFGYALHRRRAVDPFVADRSMGWFPIGLSVMITLFSAVNFLAFPTEVMNHGLYVLASLPVFVLVAIPVTRVIIPFFHGMKLTSLYAYLEQRFDRRVRLLASGLFILWRLFWMATALYATARVLSLLTGLPLWLVLVMAGGVAAFYTAIGGIRVVMWTDVIQFMLLLVGIGAAVWMAVNAQPDGFSGLWRVSRAAGQLRPFEPMDPDFFAWRPTMRISLWSALIGTFVAFLTRYGADQMVVQRYFTARSLQAAVRGFWWNVVAALVALLLLALLGLAIAATFGDATMPAMPRFAAFVRALPYGLTGLLAAGLLAATMSSVDSGINACLAAWLIDFEGRPVDTVTTRQEMHRYWGLVAGMLVVILALAFVVARTGDLFAIVNRIVNAMGAPLLALILLGMFSRTCNARGAWLGGIFGTLASLLISFGWDGLALHYYAVVNLCVTLLACWFFSAWTARTHPVTGAQVQWRWHR
jgi:SSS family transporter